MTEAAAGPWIKLIVLASQLHKRLYIRAATAYPQRRDAHRSRIIITLYYYYYYYVPTSLKGSLVGFIYMYIMYNIRVLYTHTYSM